MSWRNELSYLLRKTKRNRAEGELDDEIRTHLELEIQRHINDGLSPEAARHAALKSFGSVSLAKENSRDVWGFRWLTDLLGDGRYALRVLARAPTFTVAAVVTLALGIGLNTAVFSMINSILLRPLPYQEPNRIMQLWSRDLRHGVDANVVSPADFLEWRKEARSFESLSAYNIWATTLTGLGDATQYWGSVVTSNFFATLGIAPELGRTFSAEEETPGNEHVVIISHGFWQNRLGGGADVIGKTLTLDDASYTIIGVLGADYRHPEPFFDQTAELWRPLVIKADNHTHFLRAIGRLKPGVTRVQAQAEMTTMAKQLEKAYPATDLDWDVNVLSLYDQVTGGIKPVLFILQGAVIFVLLIACSNIANLLFARGPAREKETAIRTALGANRLRLVRQFLAESLVLGGLGGGLGLLLAYFGIRSLIVIAPFNIPRLDEFRSDGRVLAFTLLVSLFTVLVFGLAPAWQTAKVDLNGALKGTGRQTTNAIGLRNGLVVMEIALSLVLLTGAGLLLRSLIHLQSLDPGFNPENLLTMQVDLPKSKAKESQRMLATFQQILARIEGLPGVKSAAMTSMVPFGGLNNTQIGLSGIEGQPVPEVGHEITAGGCAITSDYFRTLSLPLLMGRDFTSGDVAESAPVVIVNEAFVRKYMAGLKPIGTRALTPDKPVEIVGVVADFKDEDLERETRPQVFFPLAQWTWSTVGVVIRTATRPESQVSAVKNVAWETEKDAPLTRVRTMRTILDGHMAGLRFNVMLLGLFSLVAMLLAAVGIYGVMSYIVTQRTHEIGIRMALGAQPGEIVKLIVGRGLLLAIGGVALGLIASFGLTHYLTSLSDMLSGVKSDDPITFAVVGALLTAIALIACLVPARRAMKVDPLIALRCE